MAKKKSTKKKTAPKKAAPAITGYRPLILFGTALAAAFALFFFAGNLIHPHAPALYAASLASGVLSGLSGNPVCIGLPQMALNVAGMEPPAWLATGMLSNLFAPQLIYVAAALMTALASLRFGLKTGALRYETAVLLPATALPGMVLAWWARNAGALFYENTESFFNSPYLTGALIVAMLMLSIARAGFGWRPPVRHWAFSIAAGPFAGFWIGYIGGEWIFALAVFIFFIYLFVLNETELGTITGAPIAMFPIGVAKLFAENSGGWDALIHISETGAPWAAVATCAAGITAAHLFAVMLMAALPLNARRIVFNALFFVFFATTLAGF